VGRHDGGSGYPVRVRGDLDESVSRWLWLVKWLLAIPHWIVLLFLDIAYFVVTVIAFFAILVTARYPRALFNFNVGVMRWQWRVDFYTYSALGTDRYPPFKLRSTDYPADLSVEYPERLSRGLVLVKWWLLAIPQYLILAAFVTPSVRLLAGHGRIPPIAISMLSVLVIISAIGLLFNGRYPRGMFDFIVGINRWVIRVKAYAFLMTDEYPPFRLDQGPADPGQAVPVHMPPLQTDAATERHAASEG
jgi:Domain of unknown function (DUF4389)